MLGKVFLSGPFWFILVLLAFDVILAIIYKVTKKADRIDGGESSNKKPPLVMRNTVLLITLLIVLSLAVYLPMTARMDPFHWLGFGAINFQTSRIFHYFLYFVVGTIIGAFGFDQINLYQKSRPGLKWFLWLILGFVMFFVLFIIQPLQGSCSVY